MNTIYFDTSAYLCLLLHEPPVTEVQAFIKGAAYHTSSLLFIEAHRALIRLSREKALTPSDFECSMASLQRDRDTFAIQDATIDLCFDTTFPAVSLPKSLDLLHLRTALFFQKQFSDLQFLTLDLAQRRAAQELGLSVITP